MMTPATDIDTQRGLRLEDIRHAFDGRTVVDALSLSVAPGEIVCLLGPSGCGKTTSLRIAAGLEPVQAGRVLIDGQHVGAPGRHVPPEARRVGMVFQDYALFPHLSALDNVAFGLSNMPAASRREAARGLLRKLGMQEHARAFPHTLSGGEQQRVALARALAPQPAVMLMDEPFSNLDTRLRDAIREDTLGVLREAGTATLLVTHDPDEAMQMADRIAVMREGRIVQSGPPSELYGAPADRFVAEFFGDINVLPGVVDMFGRVETVAGPVPAPDLPKGTPVEVIARPEAVLVNGRDDGSPAVVEQARALGPYAIVGLRLHANGLRLRSRVAPDALPAPGHTVGVRLVAEKAFVFPAPKH